MSDTTENPDVSAETLRALADLLDQVPMGDNEGGPLVLMRRDDLDPSKIREVQVVEPAVNYAPMGHEIIKRLTQTEGFVILTILVVRNFSKDHSVKVVLVKLAD